MEEEEQMKCEEFEFGGLGLDREGVRFSGTEELERAAAIEHANACTRCAALQDSWKEAQAELRALGAATQAAGAPLRVEMRLRQEFRTRHRTLRVRNAAIAAAWVLAGAAVVIGAVNWWNWRALPHRLESSSTNSVAKNVGGTTPAQSAGTNGLPGENSGNDLAEATLVADNNAEDFTLLPGNLRQEADNPAIVRVRLQRGALGALGLPVNEERANEWIQVDLLVGEDGQPQAVRLPQSE